MALRVFNSSVNFSNRIRYFSASSTCLQQLELVKNVKKDNVYHITLQSPKTRNALSLEMLNELSVAFQEVNKSPDVRCILLSAEGNVFSAGHNLKELTEERGKTHHKTVFATCTRFMELLIQCPIPIVAKVDGVAAAAGCQLVAMCDIVMASSRSSFSTPGVTRGLFCSTPGVAVARSVPLKTASLMLYTGLPLTAESALTAGLVSRVVPHDILDEETQLVLDSICEKSLPVIRMGKQFFQQQVKLDMLEAYRKGEDVMVNNLQLVDGQEGISSFIEKRKPNFQDR